VPDQWSSSGLDLHVRLNRARGLRSGLEHALRDAVRNGQLAPGTPLPSSRALAHDLGVARGTVSQAYDQLVAEGYLVARERAGIHVADHVTHHTAHTSHQVRPAGEDTSLSFGQLYRPPVSGVDLRPGRPDLSAFPRRSWLAATRHVLATASNAAFGEVDWTGCRELREALAGYLGRARGVVATADQIIVCAGATHALRLICQALHHAGATSIAVEDPSEPDYRTVAEQAGLATVPVPVDDRGLVVDRLTDQPAVTVTPAHQYPLGVTMSPERRTQLLAWARDHDAFILEDDYDGEFRYDRQPVGALQGLAPDRVVYTGTTSKTLAQGLRIGWFVVPGDLAAPLREITRGEVAHVGIVDQLVLARLIDTGDLDRHIRQSRSRYRHRRDRLGAAVRQLPHAQLSGIAAGLHAVLHLSGPPAAEAGLLAQLAEHAVTVDGLSRFYDRPATSPLGIVIGYAAPPEHAYRAALDTLTDALHTYPTASPPNRES
jgi:GntR family transcriptional regulator / MocR family aminotransferase